MKIALASDHAGYAEKERLKPLLTDLGLEFDDLGTVSEESVDYPDYARKVAEQVAQGESIRVCWFVAPGPAWRSPRTKCRACARRCVVGRDGATGAPA